MQYNYLIWITTFVWIPGGIFIFLNRDLFWHYKKTLGLTILFAFIFAIPWDTYAVKTGIWYFPKEANLGLNIGVLPLEEYLFMATTTLLFACITIFFKYKLKL